MDPKLPVYRQSPQGFWKQPQLKMFAAMFFVSLLYASGLKHSSVRHFMYVVAFLYPALLVILFLLSIKSYFQIDSQGINYTAIGFIHKQILWSEIERIEKSAVGYALGLGINYKPSVKRYIFGRKSRQKMFGWDEVISDAYKANGSSFVDDAIEAHNKYQKQQNR